MSEIFVPGKTALDALTPINDIGTALFMQDASSGKYWMLANVLGLPATGAAPTMLDVTVTTSAQERQIPGRRAASTYEVVMHLTVGNVQKLSKIVDTTQKFIALYGNGTGYTFTGRISAWANEAALGSVIQITANIAIQSSSSFLEENLLDLVIPPTYFTSAIPSSPPPVIEVGGTFILNVSTDPVSATVTAVSSATSVATATLTAGVLTVTGVAAGTTTITLTAKAPDFSDWIEAFNLVVMAN